MLIDKNHSLLRDNTFHIDQKCDEYVAFANVSEAIDLAMNLKEPYLLLGGGSNLLLTSDFHGKVVTPEKRVDIADWLCLHAFMIDHKKSGMLFTSLLHPSRCKPTCSTRLHERSQHQRQ